MGLVESRLYRYLPFVVFLVLTGSLITFGFSIIYLTVAEHARGDYFYLETECLELEFHRGWWVSRWVTENESGVVYHVALYNVSAYLNGLMIGVSIIVYDENAARDYMERNGLTDTYSALVFEAERWYRYMKIENENATLHFVENGTILVSGFEARYLTMKVEKGYRDRDGNIHNWTTMFISWMRNGMLHYIAFYGVEEGWSQPKTQEIFNHLLETLRYKRGWGT